MGRAEVSRRRTLTKGLRERHLRPISQIARATLAEAPGIEKALTMPAYRTSAFKLVTEADAMPGVASLYDQQFVNAGRPGDLVGAQRWAEHRRGVASARPATCCGSS
jgi:hypothetical protein